MLIESKVPLVVKLPSGRVHMRPGCPIRFTEQDALRLLARAKGQVRMIEEPPIDWLLEWRHLAAITYGIDPDDLRIPRVLSALDRCDAAFLSGDVDAFWLASSEVEEAVKTK